MSFDILKFLERQLHTSKFKRDNQLTYSPEELHELCSRSIEVISKEPSLVKINPPCVVVGDLHGQFYDLHRTFSTYTKNTAEGLVTGCLSSKYVFLGNYVDLGKHSLETATLVLTLKVYFPTKYMLLRGNHECAELNRKEGFFDELVRRFGPEEGEKLFDHFNEVFSWMPLAAVIGGKILCVHGGLSPELKSLEDIEKIPRPLVDPSSIILALDLLWSDPKEKITGFHPNTDRGRSVFFGEDEVAKFCKATTIRMILRSNQVMDSGFGTFADVRVMSIFGAPRFKDNNCGASVNIDTNGRIGINVLVPEGRRQDQIGK